MESLHTNRRAASTRATLGLSGGDRNNVVRQALLIQDALGTISAVEYLKAHDVGGAVITRVLTGQRVRSGDAAA